MLRVESGRCRKHNVAVFWPRNHQYNDSAFVNVFRANAIKIENSYLDNVSSRDVYKCGTIVYWKLDFGLEEFDEAALSFRLFGKDKKFCLYDTLVLNRDQRVG